MLGYVTCICGSSFAYYGKSKMNSWTIESDKRNKIDAMVAPATAPATDATDATTATATAPAPAPAPATTADATTADVIVPVFTNKISRFSPPNPLEQEINTVQYYYINEYIRSALSVVDRRNIEYNAVLDDPHASNFNQQMQYRRGGKPQQKTKKNKRRKTKNLRKRRKTTRCNCSRGKKRCTKRH
jgi:hypothetical protein